MGMFESNKWKIMKTHAVIGGKLLDGADLMRMARVFALAHHVSWDGSGYPYGLTGKAIPQARRIAALVDVFDALTSVRPTRKPGRSRRQWT